jgi:hypothetical protein
MESMTLSSIQFSSDSVSELDRKKKSISIARQDIKDISLKYGFIAERPMTQAVVSIGLIMLGLYLGFYPLYWMFVNNDLPSIHDDPPAPTRLKIFAYALPLIFIGAYLLQRLFIKRFYLLVHTNNDKRKLVFNDKHDLEEIQTFIMNCNSSLGYVVRTEDVR